MRSFSLGMIAVIMIAPLSSTIAFADTGSTTAAADSVVSTALTESLTAAPAPTLIASAGSALGEYKVVSCNSNSAFATNSCDQCFDGGAVKVGARMTGLFDTWTNTSANVLKAVKDEQKTPNMVKFGNSTWVSTPVSEAAIWKYSSDVAWTNTTSGSTAKQESLLQPNTKIRFIEADIGAGYTLEKTDRKNGELVGILRFPVVSHTIDVRTATEGAADTHYECVAYKLDAPAPVTPNPTPTPVKPTPPKEITKTETGPETLLLIAAAFFIAFGMMFTLRKRV